MPYLKKELREQIEAGIRELLKSLGLFPAFRVLVRKANGGGIVIHVAPKLSEIPGVCNAYTVHGKRCKLDPAPDEYWCAVHKKMRREDEMP